MDAITIQILRNKVASLVEEMHYHFYRSGYSTIIRESRDFSCVILDCDGRLIVAPPMFFHAPVYRHLVGRILKVHGAAGQPYTLQQFAVQRRVPLDAKPSQRWVGTIHAGAAIDSLDATGVLFAVSDRPQILAAQVVELP